MTKHTPGPWRVDEHGDVGAEGRHVATPSLYGDGSDDANAHLIAAAPDLLAACEAFVKAQDAAMLDGQRAFGMYVDAVDAARAAITKARRGSDVR